MEIAPIDVAVIVTALVGSFAVGVFASMKTNNLTAKEMMTCKWKKSEADTVRRRSSLSIITEQKSVSGVDVKPDADARGNDTANFFLSSRSSQFYLVGISLFASNIGSEHFVGQAGDGARRGLAVAMFEWYAAILLICLGWLFSPIYFRAKIYTIPEFLEKRFHRWCRHYLSFITVIMYVLTKMSASLYAGALVIQSALGWNLYASAGGLIVLAAVYTISGGLRAVMYTDFIQTFIFLAGGIAVAIIAFQEVGGMSGLEQELTDQGMEDHWELWKPVTDPDYPWTGILFGQPINSMWYWCMDQDIVQRVLSAKDGFHTKAGCMVASMLKIIPPFIMVMPGIIASVLYEDVQDNPDQAYIILLTRLMPAGVVGLMISSILMSMMSSLDSVFNAGSTIVTMDMYNLWRPNASERSLVWVGRLSAVMYAALSFMWIPFLEGGEGLYNTVVEIQGYITPPFGIVVLMGVVWSRVNGPGAIAGLAAGALLGFPRMIVSLAIPSLEDDLEDGFWKTFFFMNFLHFSILIWVTSAIFCTAVSLLTKAPERELTKKFCVEWETILLIDEKYGKNAYYILYAMVVAVLGTTAFLWIYFA